MIRTLRAALLAGVVAGLVVAIVQAVAVTPLILEAETYEVAGTAHHHDGAETGGTGVPDAGASWAPADGVERFAYSALTDVLTGVGFALVLSAAMTLRGGPMTVRDGVHWGGAGFLCFALLPALGLPPEVPGTEAAALAGRQTWWIGTAIGSAGGLALLAFGRGWVLKATGVAVLLVPHLIGSPQPDQFGSTAPAELAARFAVVTLAVSGLFWAVIGGLLGRGLATLRA